MLDAVGKKVITTIRLNQVEFDIGLVVHIARERKELEEYREWG